MTSPGSAQDSRQRRRHLTETNRVEAFSDGVFAIALTLLVLNLHAPQSRGGFAHELLHQWPAYLAYAAAFLNIAAIWVHHHDVFARVRQVDVALLCTNLALLLVASLFPWPASVVAAAVRSGTHADQVAANVLYASVGFLVPVAWTTIYVHLARRSSLLATASDAEYMRIGMRRAGVSMVVYPLAAAISFAAPLVALILFVVVPVFFIAALLRPEANVA